MVTHYNTIQHNKNNRTQHNTIQHNTTHHNTVKHTIMQHMITHYNPIHYTTTQHNTPHHNKTYNIISMNTRTQNNKTQHIILQYTLEQRNPTYHTCVQPYVHIRWVQCTTSRLVQSMTTFQSLCVQPSFLYIVQYKGVFYESENCRPQQSVPCDCKTEQSMWPNSKKKLGIHKASEELHSSVSQMSTSH